MVNPEDLLIKKERREEFLEKVKKLIELNNNLADILRQNKLPINNECRITIPDNEINEFKQTISRVRKWYPNFSDKEIDLFLKEGRLDNLRLFHKGTILEILATIILNKFLNENFYIVRSSYYDDFFNSVDNLIINKNTGEIVCAFDETINLDSREFAIKKERILSKNIEGVNLKHGLLFSGNEVKIQEIKFLPIFYLVLEDQILQTCLEEMKYDLDDKSDYEKNIFKFFVLLLNQQAQVLELRRDIRGDVIKRIKNFHKLIEEYL